VQVASTDKWSSGTVRKVMTSLVKAVVEKVKAVGSAALAGSFYALCLFNNNTHFLSLLHSLIASLWLCPQLLNTALLLFQGVKTPHIKGPSYSCVYGLLFL